jgi:hypothetical protein
MSLFLGGCGNEGAQEAENPRQYKADTFTILPGELWVPVEKNDFSPRMPKEALVGFTRQNDNTAILSTFTVTEELLFDQIDSTEAYANANIGQAMQFVLNYETRSLLDADIDGQETKVHIFTGRVEKDDDLSLFIQTYLVKNKKGYILTGVLLENDAEELQQEVIDMIDSFSFVLS